MADEDEGYEGLVGGIVYVNDVVEDRGEIGSLEGETLMVGGRIVEVVTGVTPTRHWETCRRGGGGKGGWGLTLCRRWQGRGGGDDKRWVLMGGEVQTLPHPLPTPLG